MKLFGIILMIVGAGTTLFSFLADVSVGSTFGTEKVVNIGLLQNQIMIFQLGMGGFISGSILFAGGAILEIIQSAKHGSVASAGDPNVIVGFNPNDHI